MKFKHKALLGTLLLAAVVVFVPVTSDGQTVFNILQQGIAKPANVGAIFYTSTSPGGAIAQLVIGPDGSRLGVASGLPAWMTPTQTPTVTPTPTPTGTATQTPTVTPTATLTPTPITQDFVRLAQIVTASSQATVDFTSISGSYTDLMIVYQCRDNVSAGTEGLFLKFNNDGTSGNYTISQYILGQQATASAGTVAASASGLFVGNATGATAVTSAGSSGTVIIANYAKTTFFKRMDGRGNATTVAGANQEQTLSTSGSWKSTAAVTRLTFNVATSFVDGSVFTLYGLR